MMVGHALLAFSLVALGARRFGWAPRRALQVGVVAGALAMTPDVDMAYALVGLASVEPTVVLTGGGTRDMIAVTEAFWGASTVVHRSATHSVLLAIPVAGAVGLWTVDRRSAKLLALSTVVGVGTVSWAVSGALDGIVVALFGLAALAVAEGIRRRTSLTPPTTAGVAFVALSSHPFGDLFTGEPPHVLYPLGVEVFGSRIALSADPTLHLLGAFGLELAVVWLGLVTYLSLSGYSLRMLVDRRATLGASYGFAALVLSPPTLDTSYHFVFSILAIGLLLAIPELGFPSARRIRGAFRACRIDDQRPLALALTGIAAVTIGWVTYLGAYLVG